MKTNTATLETLIRWLPEAIDGAGGKSGGEWITSGPDSKHLSYGPLWHAAPRTWQQLATRLQELDAQQRNHLWSRYHAGTWHRRKVHISRTGHPSLPARTEIVASTTHIAAGTPSDRTKATWHDCTTHTWPDWVAASLVASGLSTIADRWTGTLELPRELAA